jgi:hypothetical protein
MMPHFEPVILYFPWSAASGFWRVCELIRAWPHAWVNHRKPASKGWAMRFGARHRPQPWQHDSQAQRMYCVDDHRCRAVLVSGLVCRHSFSANYSGAAS